MKIVSIGYTFLVKGNVLKYNGNAMTAAIWVVWSSKTLLRKPLPKCEDVYSEVAQGVRDNVREHIQNSVFL